jgi:myo-inositol-1(or 4)-monophosphatase
MTLSAETRAAVAAARLAGRILERYFGRVKGRAGGVRLKSPKDPVTVADAAAERAIRRYLRRRYPRVGFLGEEGTAVGGPDGRWIVDPLDGTIAFVAGLPTFGVSIALERAGRLEAGVLLFPRLRELFVAERGRGAWLNGRRLRVSPTTDLAHCVVSLWHDERVWRDARLRARVAAAGQAVRSAAMFGACFSLAYVAAGRLDGYWERSAHAWDLAAGALLVREAGGRVTRGDGAPFDLDDPTVLASNGRIHDRLVGLLNRRWPPRRRERA